MSYEKGQEVSRDPSFAHGAPFKWVAVRTAPHTPGGDQSPRCWPGVYYSSTCQHPSVPASSSLPPFSFPNFLSTPDVDREVLALRREEEKLIREIKAAAKAGNTPATRVLAKSLVRLRGQVAKLQGSSAQLKGISTTITVRGSVRGVRG